MSILQERQKQLKEEFSSISKWEDRYRQIIAMGRVLPVLSDSLKTEEALVKGCQSQVWLHAELSEEGNVVLQGDSDALIVKGLVALLIRLYSGLTPEEILSMPPNFVKDIGFEGNLSPSRSNGFFNMIKQITHFATAFLILKRMKEKQTK